MGGIDRSNCSLVAYYYMLTLYITGLFGLQHIPDMQPDSDPLPPPQHGYIRMYVRGDVRGVV